MLNNCSEDEEEREEKDKANFMTCPRSYNCKEQIRDSNADDQNTESMLFAILCWMVKTNGSNVPLRTVKTLK